MGGPVAAIARPNIITPTKVEGDQAKILVSDDNARDTLSGIHKELRKMNLYNEIKTDAHVSELDLDKE